MNSEDISLIPVHSQLARALMHAAFDSSTTHEELNKLVSDCSQFFTITHKSHEFTELLDLYEPRKQYEKCLATINGKMKQKCAQRKKKKQIYAPVPLNHCLNEITIRLASLEHSERPYPNHFTTSSLT